MIDLLTCELCHVRDVGVIPDWGWYREGAAPVQPIDRCQDRVACRSRVESSRETWPLRETGEAAA